MSTSTTRWFLSKSFVQQLIILTLVFDPIGFVGGYLLGPSLGVDPLVGGVYELVLAGIPTSLHVMTHAK
jgi:hypothetical protein